MLALSTTLAASPSTKPKQPTTTYSEAWTAAPRTDRSHRLRSAAWDTRLGHVLRSALDTNVESVLVQIDFKNAFNSVSRAVLIGAVAQHHPQLLPLVCWIYRQHSNLWVEGAPPDTPPILSRKGVRQGDPLGPLLFGIVLQSVLERTNAAHEESHVLALHDDVCLIGSAPAVRLADSELTRAAGAIGLQAHIASRPSPWSPLGAWARP
jgi:hypothetical protein